MFLPLYNPSVSNAVGGDIQGTFNGPQIIQVFLTNFITIGFGVGVIILVFMLITGGIRYLASGSDKESVQKASKSITHAIIGLIILLCTYAIIGLIGFIFGINVLQINFPTFP